METKLQKQEEQEKRKDSEPVISTPVTLQAVSMSPTQSQEDPSHQNIQQDAKINRKVLVLLVFASFALRQMSFLHRSWI